MLSDSGTERVSRVRVAETESLVCEHTHTELVQRLEWYPGPGEAKRKYVDGIGTLIPVYGLDVADEFGWTCLHHGAALGLTHHIEALLDAGASTEVKSTEETSYPAGLTPLGVAKHTQHEDWGDRFYIIQVLQWAGQAMAQADDGVTWRTLQRADEARRKAATETEDEARRQKELEEAAFISAEAQAKCVEPLSCAGPPPYMLGVPCATDVMWCSHMATDGPFALSSLVASAARRRRSRASELRRPSTTN